MNIKAMKTLLEILDPSYLERFDPVTFIVLRSTSDAILNDQILHEKHTFLVQSILDRALEKINIGHYSEVAVEHRYAITFASFLKVIILASDPEVAHDLQKIFSAIDLGLIFGAPLPCVPDLLQKCATICNDMACSNVKTNDISKIDEITTTDTPNVDQSNNEHTEIQGETVNALDCPSIEKFTEHFGRRTPVKLKNCINHWPALRLWNNTEYILSKIGKRTVPVEIGSKYTDAKWTQKLMTVEEFVGTFMNESSENKGYLAQYQLFHHIPELLRDIYQPDYCCVSETKDEEDVEINAWFGPKGTISPLHYDPKHNMLTQVVGKKSIILYPPEDSPHLYCFQSELLHNTAKVDPKNPDFVNFPEFVKARPILCLLNPGDMLYIPPKWWHYVESLSVSFSVSFWWK